MNEAESELILHSRPIYLSKTHGGAEAEGADRSRSASDIAAGRPPAGRKVAAR